MQYLESGPVSLKDVHHVKHSAILSTFIKLPIVIKIFVLSIFEWPFYTGFTVNLCSSWQGLNIQADISCGAKGLNFGQGLHLHPYFVCANLQSLSC